MKNNFLLILFISVSISLFAQVNTDSLWSVWSDGLKADTTRLKALDILINEGYLETQNDSALYYVNIQIAFAKVNGIQKYYAAGLYNLGSALMKKGQLSEAINKYQLSYDLYQEQGNKRKMALSLHGIGSAYWTKGDYEQSKAYYRKSMRISTELNDKDKIAKCLNGIAYSFYQQGEYDAAIRLNEQSLKLYEEIGDDYGIAWNLNAMGVLYSTQGNREKSLEYYLKGLEINVKIGDRLSESYSLRNIGLLYFEMGDKDKALEYYEKCLTIDEEHNNKRSLAFTLGSLGYFYSEQGQKEKAMEYFQRSLVLARQIGNRDMECGSLKDIGLIYFELGKYKLSISECQKAYSIALETKSVPYQLDACECLYKAHKQIKSYARALEYNEKMLTLSDSLNVKSLSNNLQKMEYTKQIYADSLQNEENKRKVEIAHQSELREKKQAQNIAIVSGVIILLVALGLWSRMRFTKKANAQLKVERDRAAHSELVKHQFLANMSHEIRTPMNAIKGMIDILLRREPKPEQLSFLESIKESSHSLLVIINDILDLSKIESEKIILECIAFSIPELLKNVYTIMEFKAEEKGLNLILDLPPNIPSVEGDPMRLRQVLINLIGNAIKFTEKGNVRTIVNIKEAENVDYINAHFTVSDTGIGIEDDKLSHVFNSFEQAYADTSRKFGGTGLGLSISKKLIELKKGKIWVESTKGSGSQFHFIIPLKIDTNPKQVQKTVSNSSFEIERLQLKGTKILLVEDNAFNIIVAKEELEDAIPDVEVIVAENGAIAIDLARNNDFDVILMDIQLPEMNGYEATKAIKSFPKHKHVTPIIAMTANVLKEEVDYCFEAGMNDFIGKPFDIEVLIHKIYKLTKTKE